MKDSKQQLVRGMLYLAVLSILSQREDYAASILVRLEKTPFKTKVGTLYPLMNRMQALDLINSRWIIKPGKPPMRYYKITAKGAAELNELRQFMIEINVVLGVAK